MPQVGHLRLVAAVALGLSAVASAPIPEDAALQDEIAFFQRYDTNTDGFHSKKEFYYAIMEDEFEALASKYNKVCAVVTPVAFLRRGMRRRIVHALFRGPWR